MTRRTVSWHSLSIPCGLVKAIFPVTTCIRTSGYDRQADRDRDRVEANYKQGGNWYKGKVVTSYEANYRTLYDIAYDDGDAEQGVELSDLRQVGGGGESQSQKLLASQDV